MHAGRVRQVARRAVLGRHGEHVAPRAEERPVSVGRDVEVGDAVADVHGDGPPAVEVLGDRHRHLLGLLGGEVEAVEVAAVLEDDRRVAERRELDVVVGEARELLRLLRPEVVAVEVQPVRLVAVGEEVDLVPLPHRDDVLGRVARQVGGGLRPEVVEPDVVGHPAAVALPGAELAEDAVVDELLAVGRVGGEAAAGQRQFLDRTAVHTGEIKLAEEVVPVDPARAEEDVRIVLPPDHEVVRPHAVGHVVARERGRPGQALRHASLRRHQVDLGVAVVLAGEGEPLPVGGEARDHLEPDVAREAAGDAAGRGDRVEIAGVGEDDLVPVDGREPEQPRLGGLGARAGMARQHEREDDDGGEEEAFHEHRLYLHFRRTIRADAHQSGTGASNRN